MLTNRLSLILWKLLTLAIELWPTNTYAGHLYEANVIKQRASSYISWPVHPWSIVQVHDIQILLMAPLKTNRLPFMFGLCSTLIHWNEDFQADTYIRAKLVKNCHDWNAINGHVYHHIINHVNNVLKNTCKPRNDENKVNYQRV